MCSVCRRSNNKISYAKRQQRLKASGRDLPESKICRACKFDLPADNFYLSDKNDGLYQICRKCHSVRNRNSKYKITTEWYDALLLEQGGVCAICRGIAKTRRDSDDMLYVDHDHSCCPGHKSCGKCVRALLCAPCNMALGGFRDDILLLQEAQKYLEKYRLTNVSQDDTVYLQPNK